MRGMGRRFRACALALLAWVCLAKNAPRREELEQLYQERQARGETLEAAETLGQILAARREKLDGTQVGVLQAQSILDGEEDKLARKTPLNPDALRKAEELGYLHSSRRGRPCRRPPGPPVRAV